jgi:hypothetical protein
MEPELDSKELWDAEFAKWNQGNLCDEGVYSEEEWKFVVVQQDHPGMKLLRMNESVLARALPRDAPVGGCMYKVDKELFMEVCGTLLGKVMTWVDA